MIFANSLDFFATSHVFLSSFYIYIYLFFQLYLVGFGTNLVIPVVCFFRKKYESCQDLDGDGQLSIAEFWEGDMAQGGR